MFTWLKKNHLIKSYNLQPKQLVDDEADECNNNVRFIMLNEKYI